MFNSRALQSLMVRNRGTAFWVLADSKEIRSASIWQETPVIIDYTLAAGARNCPSPSSLHSRSSPFLA